MEIIKIGTTELTRDAVSKIYDDEKYVVNYSGVWQICYSMAQNQYYGLKVISYRGLSKRGRFYVMSAGDINHVLGQEILAEREEAGA